MLTYKAPQEQNQDQTTSYTSTIAKQIVKGLALIGLCAAGMYGVAQWFFSTSSNKEDENIEENSIVLTAEKATSASISQPHLIKELDLTYQTKEFSTENINYHVKRESVGSNTPLKYGDIFQVNVFPPYSEFTVTNFFSGSQGLTKLSNNNFVIIWKESIAIIHRFNLKARIFDERGNAFSDEILIYTTRFDVYMGGLVAPTTEGFATILLNGDESIPDEPMRVELLGINGITLTTVSVKSNSINPVVIDVKQGLTKISDNNFVVGWEARDDDNHGYIYFRIFGDKGAGLTNDIMVDKKIDTTALHMHTFAKLSNDGFVVLWERVNENNTRIYNFKTFDKDGVATNEVVQLVSQVSRSPTPYTLMPIKDFAAKDSFLVIGAGEGTVYDGKGVVLMPSFPMQAELIVNLNDSGYAVVWVNKTSDRLPRVSLQIFSLQLQAQGKLTWLQPYDYYSLPSILITNIIGMTVLSNNDIAVSWATGDARLIIKSSVHARIINFITNTQLTAFFINFADSYRQDSSYILSNTEIDCFNCTQPITFTGTLSDVKAGYLTSSVNNINVTTSFDPSVGKWQVTGYTYDVNPILKGLTYIPTTGYHKNFIVSIQVSDAVGSTLIGNITMIGVPIYYAPIITSNVLTLNQGEKITLVSENLAASDQSARTQPIIFYATVIQHGYFYTGNNVSLVIFSQQQIAAGQIHFVHDSSTQAPSYTITAYNGQLNSTAIPVTVYFNRPPVLSNKQLTIQNRGEKIILDASMLSATDPDDPQDQLKLIVTNMQHGQFELVNVPSQAIISFVQRQISRGEVAFVHDGSDETPEYQVSVTDNKATTLPQSAAVTFLPKLAETPSSQSYNNMVIGTTVGITGGAVAFIGGIYGLWRYRKSREFAEQRKKHPLANALREKLRLAEVEDFQSEKGLNYLNAVAQINNELRTQGIDMGQMLAEEIEQLAGHIARGVKKTLPQKKTFTGAMKLDFNKLGQQASLVLELGMPLNSVLEGDASVSEIEFSNVM